MYTEDNLLPISALQHLFFCERQCALIHIEQFWDENRFTAEGRIMHERVHKEGRESRGNVSVEYGVPLRSLELGLIGKADVIEFHSVSSGDQSLKGKKKGKWQPFPVEYKRGRPKPDLRDKVQLCAQALCLEEMIEVDILYGALFYGKTRRRVDVVFDDTLRDETKKTAERLHRLIEHGKTPKPVYMPKCSRCSLFHFCLPNVVEKGYPIRQYLAKVLD